MNLPDLRRMPSASVGLPIDGELRADCFADASVHQLIHSQR